ncbi:facilitated trehalose transporter Tret1-like isoform X2 [Cimex lectularius]|uniref:Major facilitator superfamily (MFS) profile domain-containing protein n=1 Tax=Cimex lectularius TaxID=79782 RepID=A0A8I6SN70_CIMLE|nr:facilitated trehalose transporter Tret1-like isoform X2 [Cimex lectularius]
MLMRDSSSSPETALPVYQKPSWIDVWPQIVSSIIALSSVIQPGINMAFSGILIPQLEKDSKINNFSKEEASWIASLVAICQPLGALFVGVLMDYIGRKKTSILSNVPIIAGWVILYFTTESLWPIYIARILTGIGGGMTTVGLVYVAEISHVQFRSMLLSLNSVNVAFGILITTVVGVYLEWHTATLCFGTLAVMSFCLTFFIPESPYWLVNFTDSPLDEVKASVAYLNRKSWLFKEEWARVQKVASERRLQKAIRDNGSCCGSIANKIKVYGERGCYKPLIILCIVFFLQQTSGTYVVIFYTVNIFISLGGDFGFGFNEYNATATLGVVRFVMSLVSAVLSKKIGRRPIMVISSAVMACSAFATAFFLKINDIDTISFGKDNSSANFTSMSPTAEPPVFSNAYTLVSILSFVCAGSLGQMVIPWTLISELLPTKIRASGSGIMVSYGSFLLFVVIKTFPGLLDLITLPYVFVMYAVMSIFSVIFVVFFLPETFRKNFAEIAEHFEKKRTIN